MKTPRKSKSVRVEEAKQARTQAPFLVSRGALRIDARWPGSTVQEVPNS